MSQKKPNEIPKDTKRPPAPPAPPERREVSLPSTTIKPVKKKFEFIDSDKIGYNYSNLVELKISQNEVFLNFFLKTDIGTIPVSRIITTHSLAIKLHGLLDQWFKPKEKA